MAEFHVLGDVEVVLDGAPIDVGAARQRCVLAALLIDAGSVVPDDRLIGRIWGDQPPLRARTSLHSYISRLRRALADVAGVAVVRRSGGYCLTHDPERVVVDLHRFRGLRARARADADDATAVRSLAEALGLWRGLALSGLEGEWAETERERLEQERLAALHELADVRLRLGQGGDLVGELVARAGAHPLDERVAGQCMLALHQAGCTADALEHYRRLRERLVEELGIEPGSALQDLHRQILNADPALAGKTESPGTFVTPRQLPAAPASFVGRQDVLDRLDVVDAGDTVVISAIAGAGGIGKTGLALHWAHRRLDRFPDGQLFVDLRGFSPEGKPMDPAVALRGFLGSLGVEPGRVPVDPHARAALFRSLVAGKRMLLVLDNAVDAAQVLPLLPGGGPCTVLVTSRNRLPGLLSGHAARHLPLDVLDGAEARALLTGSLGAARTASEPAAVEELVRLCGGFPLALNILAGHALTRPRLPLAALAAELRDFGLAALDGDDPAASLTDVLAWSHRALAPGRLTVWLLLASAPGREIGLPAAAALAGLSADETRAILRGLEQTSLVEQNTAGRYSMHDLIRRHAADAARALPEDERTAALRRVVDFYLHTAHAADRLLDPYAPLMPLGSPAAGVSPEHLADVSSASAWMTTEHEQLLAAQRTAARHGWHETAWQFAWVLATFQLRQGLRHESLTTWLTALEAAGHLATADPAIPIRTHRLLGYAYCQVEHHEEGIGHLNRALELAEHHGDATEQAHTHRLLTRAWGYRGDFRRALQHAERTLAHFRGVDEPSKEAEALNAAGWCNAVLGEFAVARSRCEAALKLFRDQENIDGEAAALDSLGYIDHHSGQYDRAIRKYRQALALQHRLGNTNGAADTLDNLGHSHVALGDIDEARTAWQESLELYRAQGRADSVERVLRQLDTLIPAHQRS